MIDTVIVDPTTFPSLEFISAEERKEFVRGQNIPRDQKKQEVTKDGTPVWTVELQCVTWQRKPRSFRVNVPSPIDPNERFDMKQEVSLPGLRFGVTSKDNGGYSVWFRAESIELANETSRPHAVNNVA